MSKLGFCRDCQWWKRSDQRTTYHECDAPEDEDNKRLFMFAVEVDGHFESDSSLTVRLLTGPESGCSRHKHL